jgi:uncharacterized protein (DUF302 family)
MGTCPTADLAPMESPVITENRVQHYEHVSAKSFEEVVAAFERATGSVEEGFAVVSADATNAADFKKIFKAREGRSGFMRFLTIDHGSWLGHFDRPSKAILYVLGNPLVAITMMKHDIGAGLNVPVRMYIYEGEDGAARVGYDLPSTLMSGLDNAAVTDAAHKLDTKLIALVEQISGASA